MGLSEHPMGLREQVGVRKRVQPAGINTPLGGPPGLVRVAPGWSPDVRMDKCMRAALEPACSIFTCSSVDCVADQIKATTLAYICN